MADEVHIRLRPHVSVVVHSPDDVELRHGVWNPVAISLADDSRAGCLARLINGLDGTVSPAQLATEAGVPREEVERLIDRLLQLDLVENGPSSAVDALLATTAPWRIDDTVKPGRQVVVLADGQLGAGLAAQLADVLVGSDVELVAPAAFADGILTGHDTSWLLDGLATEERLAVFEPWRDAILVTAQRIVDPLCMRVLNRACLRHGIRWVHGAIDGPFVLVGPAILPGRSACYECLETRVFLNLREGAGYQRYKRALADAQVRIGAPPLAAPINGMLSSHLAIEALNLVLTGSTFTVGRILAIHLPTMEFSFPDVLRVPGCAGCGSVPERDGDALYYDPAVPAASGRLAAQ